MKHTHLTSLLTSVIIAAALTVSSCAAFQKTNTYPGAFVDVPADAWYAVNVADAYELGFMNGTSDVTFEPDGNVTVAEAVTVASRVNAIFNDAQAPASSASGNWYDSYVAYAKEKGFVKDGQFDSYDRPATRAEMASLFYDALPADYFGAVNAVEAIPDVNNTADYAPKLLALYKAGVVMGSDAYGTFNPDSSIKRCEAAAIIGRVALPEKRLVRTLEKSPALDAYTLCETPSFANKMVSRDSVIDNLQAGWDFDNRGGIARTSIENPVLGLRDISNTEGTALIRHFNLITEDTVTAEFTARTATEGAYVEFRDKDGKSTYRLRFANGWNLLGAGGAYTPVAPVNPFDSYTFRITLDLRAGTAKTVINGVDCGTSALLSNNILNFRYGTEEAATGSFSPGRTNMFANYAVFENFDIFGLEEVYGWTKTGEATEKSGELVMNGAASVQKSFAPITTKYGADFWFIMPEGENVNVTLLASGLPSVDLAAKDGKLVANFTELYTLTKNMWYKMRISVNPTTESADIWLNGRVIGTVPVANASAFDGIRISSESGAARFDNIKAYAVADHPDYVPIPEAKASFDDYTVLLNVCNLWRNNGDHYGWGIISPYDENRPVIGYYDEGNPEAADWEIKFMVEHGIDVQAVCWYNDSSNGPLKYQHLSDALDEGYKYGKYSDYMKYCLILELNSAGFNSAQYRNYVLPYLFENYFLDDRYLKIDNKIVIHTFADQQLAESKYFGSPEGVEAELAYTEELAKSYGYDGILLFGNNAASYLDGRANYSWGRAGYTYEENVSGNLEGQKDGKNRGYYMIPTVSVGFSYVPWGQERSPNMTVEDYRKTNLWARDTYIPAYANKNDWTNNLLLVSTWNEYGEGTYIMPAGLNGFGYLDVLREVYTDLPADHEDDVPTPAQFERITHLYPQDFRILARLRADENIMIPATEPADSEEELVDLYTFTFSEENLRVDECENVVIDENGLKATAKGNDPRVFFKEAENGIDIKKVKYIRVEAAVPKGKDIKFYFAMEDGPQMSEDKTVKLPSISDDMTTYLLNTSSKGDWRGTLTTLRFDPFDNLADTDFALKSVTFCGVVERDTSKDPALVVNGIAIESGVPYEEKDGKVLFPFDPQTAVHYILHTYMTWDKANGVLKIEGNRHTVTYTVGKNTVNVDGADKALGYTMYLSDGLPMIDFADLCKALGYTVTVDGKHIDVKTPQFELYDALQNTTPGVWNFDTYTSENWTSGNMNLSVDEGLLHVETTDDSVKDPIMMNTDIELTAAKYKALKFRVRYEYDNDTHRKEKICMYFITNTDPNWAENKNLRSVELPALSSDGKWEEYTINLADYPTWRDKITSIRFDPFNGHGWMDIDYILFEEDPNYDEEAEKKKEFMLVNGDAEDVNNVAFNAPSATVTIEEDPDKPGNHYYQVITNKNEKAWIYFQQNYKFQKGKTYKLSFDAKALPDSAGNMVDQNIVINLQYKDNAGALENGTGKDHIVATFKLSGDGSWMHCEKVWKIATIDSQVGNMWSVYIHPPTDETSGSFCIDNISVEILEDEEG